MSQQTPHTQEVQHRGMLREGLRLVGHVGAAGMVLVASWVIAADASALTSKPTSVQGAVLIPPVGMTGASDVVAVPLRGDIPSWLQMNGPAMTANRATDDGVLSLPVVAPATSAATPGAVESVTHGRSCDMPVYKPKGEIRSAVPMLSGDPGWAPAASRMAKSFAQQGVLVAGLSTPTLSANLEANPGGCAFPDGNLENFSRFPQAYGKVSSHYPPILVGDNGGGALAYAMTTQACPNIFAEVMSMEFCPVLGLHKPLCKGKGIHFSRRMSESRTMAKHVKPPENAGMVLLPVTKLPAPWATLQSFAPTSLTRRSGPLYEARATQAFIDTISRTQPAALPATASAANAPPVTAAGSSKIVFVKLVVQRKASLSPPPAAVSDLPIIEVPVQPDTSSELFTVLLSGGDGWAGLGKGVTAALFKSGASVVGIDLLRHLWAPCTPVSTAADMDHLVRFYVARWKKQKALLIGYSQGAGVLPFVADRLPATSRERVTLAVMIGLSKRTDFEFHMANWVSNSVFGLPILSETRELPAGLGMYIYGREEKDTNCSGLDPKQVQPVKLPGGHHFDGDYAKLARTILEDARASDNASRRYVDPGVDAPRVLSYALALSICCLLCTSPSPRDS